MLPASPVWFRADDGIWLVHGPGWGVVLVVIAMVSFLLLTWRTWRGADIGAGRSLLTAVFTVGGALTLSVLFDRLLTGGPGYSLLGAGAGGALATLLAERMHRRAAGELLVRLAPGAFALAALARTGCLLGGCEPGRPWQRGDVGWPIHHGPDTVAHTHALQTGAIAAWDAMTPAVHAFAAYDAVALGALAVLALWLGRSERARDVDWSTRAATLAVAFVSIRAITELFREAPGAISPWHPALLAIAATLTVVFAATVWRRSRIANAGRSPRLNPSTSTMFDTYA